LVAARDYEAAVRVAETMTQADVTPDYLTLATLLQLFRKLGYIDGAADKERAIPFEGGAR